MSNYPGGAFFTFTPPGGKAEKFSFAFISRADGTARRSLRALSAPMWGGAPPDASGEGASFRFNFGGGADAEPAPVPSAVPADAATAAPSEALIPGVEVLASEVPDPAPGWVPETVLVGDVPFVKGASSGARYADVTEAVPDADEARRSDLVKGKYEGGAKLWECAVDLTRFLLENDSSAARDADAGFFLRLKDARVLELGCGHGLPGLACAMRGAREVVFADYNPDVLQTLTVPNARANGFSTDASDANRVATTTFRFLGGDWGSLSRSASLLEPGAFDVVLAAETVYEPSSFEKHVEILKRAVRRKTTLLESGVAFVAAKSYYFGVGGGARSFRARLESDGDFAVECVQTLSDGASNVREILKVTWAEQGDERSEARRLLARA